LVINAERWHESQRYIKCSGYNELGG